jgi:DNA-binding transcriptional ArsR family regulator/biotin operon repressor
LKFKQATIALALILIIAGCYAASAYPQNVSFQGYTLLNPNSGSFDKTALLAIPMLTAYTPTVGQPPPTPTNSTRMEIYNYVNANPGVQFRAICAGLTLPVGLVQYHLRVLLKSGLVSFVRDGKYKRFFVSKKYTKKQIAAITALRHKTAKRIFEVLLNKKQLSHGKLADELCISSQALTWQMKSLRRTKYVLQVNDGLKTVYSIDQNAQPLLETSLAIIN